MKNCWVDSSQCLFVGALQYVRKGCCFKWYHFLGGQSACLQAICAAVMTSILLLFRTTLSSCDFDSSILGVSFFAIFVRVLPTPSLTPSVSRSVAHGLEAVLPSLKPVCAVQSEGSCIWVVWHSVIPGSLSDGLRADPGLLAIKGDLYLMK